MVRRLALVIAAGALLAPSHARAADWTVSGGGFGHGGGMSQWGAYGFARHGRSAKQILAHYYKGSYLGKTGAGTIRVLLRAGAPSVGFSGAVSACGAQLDPTASYSAVPSGSGVALQNAGGGGVASCGALLRAKSGGRLRVAGKGTYRGSLEVRPAAGSGLNAVNAVKLEHYVRGVVPNEVPSSWPVAALRAQAIAARSYVLATRSGGASDVFDDTRDQVYGGRGSEKTSTNRAVKATKRRIVRYAGRVAVTFFFSSSGGRTESIQFAMPGAPARPYLKSVKDPYDRAAPLHRWRRRFSDAQMQAALGDLVPGALRSIEVTQTGRSPRIVRATLHGSAGDAGVSGATLRTRLGLPSTWASFATS